MANQVNVELVDLLFKDIPGTQIFQLSYTENLNATTETAEVANEANREAESANTRNDEQDRELASQAEKIETTQQQLSNAISGVSENKQAIETHIASNSQHGVTGNNVGTEDYAQDLIGGVVLLATNVAELVPSTVNVDAAPAAYDQAYAQSQADAINSLATDVNGIINKINELIQGQITAKQMGV